MKYKLLNEAPSLWGNYTEKMFGSVWKAHDGSEPCVTLGAGR